ncbi:antibiotic ABC transporter permease [Clostridium botulinum]|uniref:efflux RND transporter permease subunit n=1 Tax=Clostridium TaxID=1485 RepID=UPI0013F90324|nr:MULTISPECIES: efflux RND transporter permease subunit [Clostridium]MCS6130121.1 antibiotic ABC transporter permease [Clostridium botulinum]NFL44251.1 antibiotic ABC transporter permease [Clostridium botulinum]NFL90069.1 antibiotic ABC transporter permease [Clostridium botulinum]
MKKISDFIVNNSKLIIIFYLAFITISVLGIKFINIEYDLSSYLPKYMTSYKGKELLESEFEMGGLGSLMIKSTDVNNIKDISNKISSLDGVKEVLYFDTNIKEGYNLIDIVFKEGSTSISTQDTIDKIKDLVSSEEYYFGGESAIAKDMVDTTNREIIFYSLLAFSVIAIILSLGSSTYFEPIYFFLTIGVAILINMGSNIIFSTISSNTNSVASILQLAVSMDYSIFLLHRYHSEKIKSPSKEAMKTAIFSTFGTVSASALTTVCGFLALTAMKYGIGKDMGLVLAKGVFLSLICVMTLLPSLVLTLEKYFKGKEHKILIPSLGRFANLFIKNRYVALVIAALIVLPVFIANSKVSYYYSNEKTLKDNADSIVATKKINDIFGVKNQIVTIVPLNKSNSLQLAMNEIKNIDGVKNVLGLYSLISDRLPLELIPKEIVNKFQNDNFTYFAINLDRPMEGEKTSSTLTEIKDVLNQTLDSDYYLTGEAAVYDDLKTVTLQDFKVVTLVSIALVGLILAITFKSISIPIILLLIIQLGIWINLSIPYYMGTELNFITFIILGAIQLGATVDYAILFTNRYKENLKQNEKERALIKTIDDTSRSILTSASILIAGTLSVYLITTIRSAAELTLLIARGSIISCILVFILLPAMLYILDPIIKITTLNWHRK